MKLFTHMNNIKMLKIYQTILRLKLALSKFRLLIYAQYRFNVILSKNSELFEDYIVTKLYMEQFH
jgi:hypothetical protein